jgi:hypothetical protein
LVSAVFLLKRGQVMAITINPLEEGAAGDATQVTLQAFEPTEVLTALKNGSGNLELISWYVDTQGIERGADSGDQAGNIDEVSLTITGRQAITAVRNGSGDLELISWKVPEGLKSITREKTAGAGTASYISSTFVGPYFLTALRNGSGDLEIISWSFSDEGDFARLADSGKQAGEASLVTICSLGSAESPSNTFVTAVKNGSGNLELIAWELDAKGAGIKRLFDSGHQAGAIQDLALLGPIAGAPFGTIVTAVKNGSGDLELISWQVETDGFVRRADSGKSAGNAINIAITAFGPPPPVLITTMQNGSGNLELIAYALKPGGGLSREGSYSNSSGPEAAETSVVSLGGTVCTAIRSLGFLKVETWAVSG